MQAAGVVPVQSLSPGTGDAGEQQTAAVVSQSLVSGCRRPKWSQGILRDERDAGEPKKILKVGEGTKEIVLLCSFSCKQYSFRVFIISEGS